MRRIIGAKKPFELFKLVENTHTSTGVWACGKCGRLYEQQEQAAKCCEAPFCNECKQQYIEASYYALCPDCVKKRNELKEQARWDKMPLIEYENGPVVDNNGDYYSDLEEFIDHIICNDYDPDDRPGYVETCDTVKIGRDLNIDRIMDQIIEDMMEELEPDYNYKIQGEYELREAIQKFKTIQTEETWIPNRKKIKVCYNEPH